MENTYSSFAFDKALQEQIQRHKIKGLRKGVVGRAKTFLDKRTKLSDKAKDQILLKAIVDTAQVSPSSYDGVMMFDSYEFGKKVALTCGENGIKLSRISEDTEKEIKDSFHGTNTGLYKKTVDAIVQLLDMQPDLTTSDKEKILRNTIRQTIKNSKSNYDGVLEFNYSEFGANIAANVKDVRDKKKRYFIELESAEDRGLANPGFDLDGYDSDSYEGWEEYKPESDQELYDRVHGEGSYMADFSEYVDQDHEDFDKFGSLKNWNYNSDIVIIEPQQAQYDGDDDDYEDYEEDDDNFDEFGKAARKARKAVKKEAKTKRKAQKVATKVAKKQAKVDRKTARVESRANRKATRQANRAERKDTRQANRDEKKANRIEKRKERGSLLGNILTGGVSGMVKKAKAAKQAKKDKAAAAIAAQQAEMGMNEGVAEQYPVDAGAAAYPVGAAMAQSAMPFPTESTPPMMPPPDMSGGGGGGPSGGGGGGGGGEAEPMPEEEGGEEEATEEEEVEEIAEEGDDIPEEEESTSEEVEEYPAEGADAERENASEADQEMAEEQSEEIEEESELDVIDPDALDDVNEQGADDSFYNFMDTNKEKTVWGLAIVAVILVGIYIYKKKNG